MLRVCTQRSVPVAALRAQFYHIRSLIRTTADPVITMRARAWLYTKPANNNNNNNNNSYIALYPVKIYKLAALGRVWSWQGAGSRIGVPSGVCTVSSCLLQYLGRVYVIVCCTQLLAVHIQNPQ